MTNKANEPDAREELKQSLFGKKKHTLAAILIAVCVIAAVCVGVFFLTRKPESTTGTTRTYAYDAGAGNFSMESCAIRIKDTVYYIEPTKGALCSMKNHVAASAKCLSESKVLFLTNVEDKLYYLNADTYTFMEFVDGKNDKIAIADPCYYPYYYKGKLYFINASDYIVYVSEYKNGIFQKPKPVMENIRACFSLPFENRLYFVSFDDFLLYSYKLDNTEDPVAVSTAQVDNYLCGSDGFLYFTELLSSEETEEVTGVTQRVASGNYDERQELLRGMNSYINCYNGYLYYLEYTQTGEEEPMATAVYRVPVDGSGAPEMVISEPGYQLHFLDGYLYYTTINEAGMETWKRIRPDAEEEAVEIPSTSLLPYSVNPENVGGFTFDDDGNLQEVEGADIQFEADGSVSIGDEPTE